MKTPVSKNTAQWFVMRDLTRWNSKSPAYRLLKEMGMEVFVPMVSHVSATGGGICVMRCLLSKTFFLFMSCSRALMKW